jgi:hypothetical protein
VSREITTRQFRHSTISEPGFQVSPGFRQSGQGSGLETDADADADIRIPSCAAQDILVKRDRYPGITKIERQVFKQPGTTFRRGRATRPDRPATPRFFATQ